LSVFHPLARRHRARGALVILAVLLGVLLGTFFRLQVLRSSTWALRSESNRLRPLPIPAPRGTIYDRKGRIVADNVPAYSISILPAVPDSMRATLARLLSHLDLAPEEVEALEERMRVEPRRPLLVAADASFDQVSALEERRASFPRVLIETRPKRRYVDGPAVAHLVGYVGEITREELESPRFRDYEQRMIVGKAGVERVHEERLQGGQGVRYVEVDALGRVVGSFRGVARNPARPGEELHLNLDLELQSWIHRIFPDSMRGAVVALDARDGGVLALYSSPTFDPNDFVGGIPPKLWTELNRDPTRPLFNRAVQGLYPPASTWKLASAAIGLELGLIDPDEEMPIPCRGGMRFGNRYFRCWRPEGHGSLDLAGAIRHSCDVYFYQLGLRVGLERLVREGLEVGFARRCGIDLPEEARGIFPEGPEFWERRFGYPPTEAEALNLAIGQGPNSQTPLKMAQFYAALAGDGTAPAPRVVGDAPVEERWRLDLSPRNLEALRAGLRGVMAPGGTAYLSSVEHWDLMGKTGTGQNAQDPDRDHAWFAGMAGPPGGEPEIVVVVLVEFGDSGSGVAAPLVAKTADYYLRREYGVPVDTIQTLGEHWRTGTPAPWANRGVEPGDGEATEGGGP